MALPPPHPLRYIWYQPESSVSCDDTLRDCRAAALVRVQICPISVVGQARSLQSLAPFPHKAEHER